MRISFSEQFLWGLYNITEKISDITDIFKIKTFNQIISDQTFWRNLEKKRNKKQFRQFINYLKQKGLINVTAEKGILITLKGKEKILKAKYKFVDKKKREDGQWIMLMYDIPISKNRQRYLLRSDLKNLGFQQLQKSIWVCPYDVFEETEKAINSMFLSGYTRLFLIKEMKK